MNCIDTRAGPRVTARLNLHSVWQRAYRFRAFHLGFGSYKSAWMLAHKIRRAMEIADGFPLIADMQADETGIPYRLKGSEPPPGGRSREGRLMIAGAVEVFGENGPGCVELRGVRDQFGPTLKAFLEDATAPGTWIAADGWAGYDGLENHTAIAVGDRPAHEVLEWVHRVFSNLKRRGLGVLHGFRCKHLDWQLVEWSFRRNWRQPRGETLFALLGPGADPPQTAALRLNSRFAVGSQADPSKSRRKPRGTSRLRSFRPNFRARKPAFDANQHVAVADSKQQAISIEKKRKRLCNNY